MAHCSHDLEPSAIWGQEADRRDVICMCSQSPNGDLQYSTFLRHDRHENVVIGVRVNRGLKMTFGLKLRVLLAEHQSPRSID